MFTVFKMWGIIIQLSGSDGLRTSVDQQGIDPVRYCRVSEANILEQLVQWSKKITTAK